MLATIYQAFSFSLDLCKTELTCQGLRKERTAATSFSLFVTNYAYKQKLQSRSGPSRFRVRLDVYKLILSADAG